MFSFNKSFIVLVAVMTSLLMPSAASAEHGHRPAAANRLVELINDRRANHDRPALRRSVRARRAAIRLSHSMLQFDYFGAHLMPGSVPFDRWIKRKRFIPFPAVRGHFRAYVCGKSRVSARSFLRSALNNPAIRRMMLSRYITRLDLHWSRSYGPYAGYNGRGRCEHVTSIVWGRT